MYDWSDETTMKELSLKKEALMNKYPLLYGDKNKSMQETCMCWGLDISAGWLKLVDELSVKLETEIQNFLDENKDDLRCEKCSRKKQEHTDFYTFLEDGDTVVPIEDIEKFKVLNPNTKPEDIFSCLSFEKSYPKASQVKEKYGSLRFYMTTSTDKMETLINDAETLSYKTCESCGEPGSGCHRGSWIKTLCVDCANRLEYSQRTKLESSPLTEEEIKLLDELKTKGEPE